MDRPVRIEVKYPRIHFRVRGVSFVHQYSGRAWFYAVWSIALCICLSIPSHSVTHHESSWQMQRSNSVERNLNGMPQPIVQDLANEVGKAVWGPLLAPDMVSPSVIKQALERAQGILLPGLKEDGNFLYQFIQIVDAQGNSENSVRQAGALWTLALIHQYSSLNKVQGANRSTNMALPSRILALQYKGGRRMTQQQDTTSSLGLLGGGGFRSPLVSSSFRIEVAQYSEHELIVALNVLNEPP